MVALEMFVLLVTNVHLELPLLSLVQMELTLLRPLRATALSARLDITVSPHGSLLLTALLVLTVKRELEPP